MESRRFILALSLSLIVFVVYVRFFAPKPPEMPVPAEKLREEEAVQPRAESRAPARRPVETAPKIMPAVRGRQIVIETDLVRAVLNTAGGVLTGLELKNYREADKTPVGLIATYEKIMGRAPKVEQPKKELGNVQLVPVDIGMDRNVMAPLALTPLQPDLYKLAQVEYRADRESLQLSKDNPSGTIALTYTGPAGILIEKRLTFHNQTYDIEVAVTTKGFHGYDLFLGTDFGIADKVSRNAAGKVGLVAMVDGKTVMDRLDKIKGEVRYSGTIAWFGHEDKYFTATLLYGDQGGVTAEKALVQPPIGDLLTSHLTVPEKTESRTFKLFAGPKNYSLLQKQGHGLEQMVDFGWFKVLAKPMFWLMQQFHRFTGNYGVAIILLTIVVRALLFYPSLKSATAMEEMKKIQPQMTALREKYKKDPQRMNQEMMKLYKEHKVNPLGGCLPMLLQLPFFIALYNVLSASIELRQSPFISFWIKDLSVHDPYFILPILMGGSMILTMRMTSTSVDPQQQKIMMFMNIAFIFLFAWLPAGLLLYITLSNVLSMVQQLYVRKLIAS